MVVRVTLIVALPPILTSLKIIFKNYFLSNSPLPPIRPGLVNINVNISINKYHPDCYYLLRQ